VKITEEFLNKISLRKDGWNRPQLALLGVAWPPAQGWKQTLLGKEISEETARRLEELRDTTPKQRRAIEAGQVDLHQTDLFG
jgi:hypothetical protein